MVVPRVGSDFWYTSGVRINKYTKELEILVVKIANAAKENNKKYLIGGGLAIDLSLWKISRNHHDIDFHPMLEDYSWWIEWFENQGYKVKNRQDNKFPETWWVYNSNEEAIVDMWPFQLKNGILLINQEGKYLDAGRHWEETMLIIYKNVEIRIENPLRVLEQKNRHANRLGQKYRPIDLHDFKLLNKEPK